MFTEQDAEDLAKKALGALSEKIKKELSDEFYSDMEEYLYEHYQNAKERIDRQLIEELSDRFIQDPSAHKFRYLRERLFTEHKEEIGKVLTDEAIVERLEEMFLEHTSKDYWLSWKWKDGIVDTIIKYWHDFEGDERINERIVREIRRRDEHIERLKAQLKEIQGE